MISWEHAVEPLLQLVARRPLRDRRQLERFRCAAPRYEELCRRLLGEAAGSNTIASGYDWTAWAATIRRSFASGVPLGFLWHPTLRATMVFAARHGIRETAHRIGVVRETFGEDDARRLLREDYIGLPTITSVRYRTSANRAHHASHLAWYRRGTGRPLWECRSVIEWGGGFGSMARLLTTMNPDLAYAIIDLPEVLALQFVYLTAVVGEGVVVIADPARPQLEPGKIVLISSQDGEEAAERLRADAFVSTFALTESPPAVQIAVAEHHFFGAGRVLISAAFQENNVLDPYVEKEGLRRLPVPAYRALGANNEYWIR